MQVTQVACTKRCWLRASAALFPLKSVADFTRNIGRFLRVTRSTGKPVTGKLVAADEENLTLTLKGNAGDVVVPRSEVLVAKVDVQI